MDKFKVFILNSNNSTRSVSKKTFTYLAKSPEAPTTTTVREPDFFQDSLFTDVINPLFLPS